ncbi:MAG TPA: type IIL restriction-modification enzyme MmeI [Pirellulales bacterium]|jgi:hypothetical protein|nr:type IIL restriction-modification enzyme MmeI [Pirellulales bacterium]
MQSTHILLAREAHFPATIADLYDPDSMPDNLRQAHERNDETLERIYIGRRVKNDTERLEKLFDLYTQMTAGKESPKKPPSAKPKIPMDEPTSLKRKRRFSSLALQACWWQASGTRAGRASEGIGGSQMTNEVGHAPMDDPLAYFLTWTTYGSWLPGDERGWVKKPGQFRAPDVKLQEAAQQRMTETALTLDTAQRRIVEDTITDHCGIRGWHLHAVNARTQYVHVVVSAPGRDPEDVMDQFKAWCTRRLKKRERSRQSTGENLRQNWWTQRGSKRWSNDADELEAASRYVREEQGEPTPRPPEESEDTQG